MSLLTPEILDQVNQVVVNAGHQLEKKEAIQGRCDSFVVKTDVHFPTDLNLLRDACRKTVEIAGAAASKLGATLWRQQQYLLAR